MWQGSTRRFVLACVSILLGITFLTPPAAYADPTPSATGDLQGLAESIQQKLVDAQAAVVAAQSDLKVEQERADSSAARAEVAAQEYSAQQAEVGKQAAAIYKSGYALNSTIEMLSATSVEVKIDRLQTIQQINLYYGKAVAAASAAAVKAAQAKAESDSALAEVQVATAKVQSAADLVASEAFASGSTLSQSLGGVDAQYKAQLAAQQKVNENTATAWAEHLTQLSAAEAAAPAVASVTNAIRALGAPYAANATGPASYDCRGFVTSMYSAVGVALPPDIPTQFAVTAPIGAPDIQPGDLVFIGNADAGLHTVGIVFDATSYITADGPSRAVAVREIQTDPNGDYAMGFGRPTLPNRAPVPAPSGTGLGFPMKCGNIVYPASYNGSKAWGNYPNGLIPPSALCSIGVGAHQLRCDAAQAFKLMSAAYSAVFGTPICVTDSYRSFQAQATLYAQKPGISAIPGTSNHGWALAIDACGGIQGFGTAQYSWMIANAGKFGWLHPTWADPGNGREEPWHWEYAGG
ncbi:cell wall-associated NlpC family hydrolase [Antricoccus suffuscus]|uniref:Cell wall-associated NlpC family hydrolase n=1 Tax=Antricoccus suffuscus TaxID=1629062 RepID=A0A2T0ZYJ5_9ACTN|nr:M15 family metallopeptidase [Antricoccus suffuscus]PRZ41364.1 cell wall-associated NlpC family hydrolase [Antricoccus suffuscus]